jgi:ATP-dependent DNA helicase RecG
MENGLQVAFMAPTEILAGQHYGNIARLLASSRFRVDLLTGSTPGCRSTRCSPHRARHDDLDRRDACTGAGAVTFHKLGSSSSTSSIASVWPARGTAREGLRPDVLLMTATPIPRTLALTDYSELDVSKIPDLPPGASR